MRLRHGRLGGLPKCFESRNLSSGPEWGGLPNPTAYTIGEEWSPSPTPKGPGVTQESPMVVRLMCELHHGDSHSHGSRCRGRAPKEGLYVPEDTVGGRGGTMGVREFTVGSRVGMSVPGGTVGSRGGTVGSRGVTVVGR